MRIETGQFSQEGNYKSLISNDKETRHLSWKQTGMTLYTEQKRFSRINNIVGWIVGLIACTVYILTMEPTGSFWDCGEFISSCYKLQIPHPPGAPLFILMGRFFIILFGNNPHTAARAVNALSAIASGLSILFLFWSITHIARKIVQKNAPRQSNQQLFTIMSAGVIGALAYTFCDSFWYSAVEGEVYATSAFFTALVFWAILKWENRADQPGADKWIIFIFFMIGLSIGVHLLNLLTIPAIVMVYYFRRYKPTIGGTILALLIGCTITGLVLKFVIQYSIKGAGALDIFFVNSLGMPFFVGFAVFFVLLAGLLVAGIRYAVRKRYYYLRIGIWCIAFMLLGYSTYFTTLIRSNADPAVDMFNVDNPVSLVSYLGRENYGDWPILYGPDFQDQPPVAEAGDLYVRSDKKYEVAGKKYAQDWGNTPSAHVFPRMWNNSNARSEIDTYRKFSGMEESDQPAMADNIKYFLRYQVGWMYLRYFMWNFSGKQNDGQGYGNIRDSNWISGIPVLDNMLYGDQHALPDSIHNNNKSYNRMYMLPLILGLIGLVFLYRRNRRDWLVTGLLFFFTGLAIVLYLNQAGLQPRERDYAFAGSFYVFAIWIGLGVMAIQQQLEKFIKGPVAGYAAAGICVLAVPVLMASQEWDDHDRSKKTLARDLAIDYLESCPPNAVLFSIGDNDTYPLWYAQEVEGIRPDVRIVIRSLLSSDWYINQLRYKINRSDPFDVIFTPDQIMGDRRSVVYFSDKIPGFGKNTYYDLYDTFRTVVAKDDPRYTAQAESGTTINLLPAKQFSVPVDLNRVRGNGTVHAEDNIVRELHLDIPAQKQFLDRGELAMLAIIAANQWKRPICFTSPLDLQDLGLTKYVRRRGLSYQLVPVENGRVDNEVAYRTVMEKFRYGNAGTPGIYYDEANRQRLNDIKFAHIDIAQSLIAAGRKAEARNILEHFDQNVSEANLPYGMTSSQGNLDDRYSAWFLEMCFASGDMTLARKVSASLKKDLQQQMHYYRSLGEPMTDEQLAGNAQQLEQGRGGSLSDRQVAFVSDILSSWQLLTQINELEKQ
ncbi:MAG TPA: DUF2723 domain-containing protein [Puia sp.]|nr:DUF2723 domain-containing protein [Puia sp.]